MLLCKINKWIWMCNINKCLYTRQIDNKCLINVRQVSKCRCEVYKKCINIYIQDKLLCLNVWQ